MKSPIKRIEFLAKKFDVFTDDELGEMNFYSPEEFNEGDVNLVSGVDDSNNCIPYAVYNWDPKKYKKFGVLIVGKVRVYENVFINIVQSDPTQHKEYVQWMLTTFVRLIKNGDSDSAKRFVNEDLGVASNYLEIFHAERHKPKFKELCSNNLAFKDVKTPSDINQYRDLSQLFDAVDPYIVKNSSKLEKDIRVFTKLGHGKIEYEDRKVIVFTPKTIKGSRLFAKFTRWCTTGRVETFNSYVKKKTSKGYDSKLYIIIPKTYLLNNSEKTDDLYQLHFETGQFMDKSDRSLPNLAFLIKDNNGLRNYFYDLLVSFAISAYNDSKVDKYIKGLEKFGFYETQIDILPDYIEDFRCYNKRLTSIDNIVKFKRITTIFIRKCGLKSLPQNIGMLQHLGVLSIPDNEITEIPNSIGKLRNLTIINISGNNLIDIPESISELDSSNGGSLEYFSYSKNSISDKLLLKIKRLLPNAVINEYND